MGGTFEKGLLSAVSEVDSVDKFKTFMLESLVQNVHRFPIMDDRDDYGAEDIGRVYNYLKRGIGELEQANLKPGEKKKIRSLLEKRVGQFEEAALSLISDRETFFTKTKTGNEGTISEFVGTVLISELTSPNHESPNKISGKIAQMIIPHIEYEAILSGEVKFGRQRYDHNAYLLGLLFDVKTQTIPGLDYWRGFERNEDFVLFSYHALKDLNDPTARQLIPRIVASHHKNYGTTLDEHTKFWANFKFDSLLTKEFGDAYKEFLDDPSNEYGTTIRAMTDTPIKKAPEVTDYLQGGQIILLISYKQTGTEAKVDVVYIDNEIHEYSFKTSVNKTTLPAQIPRELKPNILKIVKGFQEFREQYYDHLATIKPKK